MTCSSLSLRSILPLALGSLAAACGEDTSPSSSPDRGAVDAAAGGERDAGNARGDGGEETLDGSTASDGGDWSGGRDASVLDDGGARTDGDTPDPRTRVEVDFVARVGERAFACGEIYPDVGATATTVEPRDLRMFVQDLALLRAGDGIPVPVELEVRAPWQNEHVGLLDFEDRTGACGQQGTTGTNSVLTGFIEPGEYSGLSFTIGVPEAVNHRNPLALRAPLSEGPLHWGWLGGFIFFKGELQPVGEGGASSASLAHMGSRACSGSPGIYACAIPNRSRVVFSSFDVATQRVVIDVAVLFADTDLTSGQVCHSENGAHCAGYFAKLGVDFDTGLPRETQGIFTVE